MSAPWFTYSLNLDTGLCRGGWTATSSSPELRQKADEFACSLGPIVRQIFQRGIVGISGRFTEHFREKFSTYEEMLKKRRPNDPDNRNNFPKVLEADGIKLRFFLSGELSHHLGDHFVRLEPIYETIATTHQEKERAALKRLLKQEADHVQRILEDLKNKRFIEGMRVRQVLYREGHLSPEKVSQAKDEQQMGREAKILLERHKETFPLKAPVRNKRKSPSSLPWLPENPLKKASSKNEEELPEAGRFPSSLKRSSSENSELDLYSRFDPSELYEIFSEEGNPTTA